MKIIGALFLAFSLGLFSAGQAFAHAHLHKADPAQNAVLHEAPTAVTLKFSEELETALSKIEVTDVSSGRIVSTGKASDAGQGSSTLQIRLQPLGNQKARLKVSWKAVSKDTHRMQGSYEFTFDPKK